MKLRFKTAVYVITMLLGTITCLIGCATTGTDRATKTTTSMQEVEEDYKQASVQIDATRATLEDLVKPDQTDMKKAYDAYAKDAKKMEQLGKQLDKHTEKMNTRGNQYFTEWESSYTNPEIRELSERRRIELRKGYAQIADASIGVKGALKSYLTDIMEIRKYLSNDLTPPAIESIRPVAQTAVKNGENLKETIKPVLTAIDRVKADMTQGGINKGPENSGESK